MTDRKTASTINDTELDQLYAELAALRAVARGYCPACGRGDAAPTTDDWEQQKQRADQAETEVQRWLAFIERGSDTHMQFSVIRDDGSTEQLPCADWCHACRVEKAEAALARIQALADEYPAGIDTALIHEALDQPGPETGMQS